MYALNGIVQLLELTVTTTTTVLQTGVLAVDDPSGGMGQRLGQETLRCALNDVTSERCALLLCARWPVARRKRLFLPRSLQLQDQMHCPNQALLHTGAEKA